MSQQGCFTFTHLPMFPCGSCSVQSSSKIHSCCCCVLIRSVLKEILSVSYQNFWNISVYLLTEILSILFSIYTNSFIVIVDGLIGGGYISPVPSRIERGQNAPDTSKLTPAAWITLLLSPCWREMSFEHTLEIVFLTFLSACCGATSSLHI